MFCIKWYLKYTTINFLIFKTIRVIIVLLIIKCFVIKHYESVSLLVSLMFLLKRNLLFLIILMLKKTRSTENEKMSFLILQIKNPFLFKLFISFLLKSFLVL